MKHESFGKLIRCARHRKRLTLEAVGKRVGLTKGGLSGLETEAITSVSAKVVRKMARVLGLDRRELMRLAWLPKMPKEIRHLLEATDARTIEVGSGSEISTEAAAKVFKEIFAPDGSATPPRDVPPSDPNTGTYGPVSVRVDTLPVRPVDGDGA